MTNWQTIDTAPKDGSLVLAWRDDWEKPAFVRWLVNPRTNTAFWNNDGEVDSYENEENPPTHWLPIQEPTSN